jgi:hypothetical protein
MPPFTLPATLHAVTLLGRIHRLLIVLAGALAIAAASSSVFAQSGVDIEVDQFGVGLFRPGGVVPVRLKLTSNLDKATAVWVQWQVADADGDTGEYGRSLTVSPGQPAFVWLYAPVQPNDDLSSVYTVRVFEERDGERRGELGGRRISPGDAQAQMADLAAGMIAIVGDRRMSLDDYSLQGGNRMVRPVSGHEDTRVASNLKTAQLPDRWYGLAGFEAIAWAGDEGPPQAIDHADALRQYVQWGGHLIIVLPTAGNPWGLGAQGQTLLEDLLPCRTTGVMPRRDEAVPLRDLLPIMSKTQNVERFVSRREPPEFAIRVFKDPKDEFDVIDNGYEPLIALPDGRVIAVQKRVGFGRITVIGVDLADGRLASLSLPQADVFWNRVLGRRMDTPTINELQAMEKADRLAMGSYNTERNMGSGGLFTTGINMTGTAGAGLLLAFLMFVAYWLVATFSYFTLKHYQLARHAWLAFAGTAAVFTVIAWGSVGLIPQATEVQHITILDHIAAPPGTPADHEQFQRAFSFFSVYLPDYGFTRLALEGGDSDRRNLLLPWTPPGEQPAPFPNTDNFRVDVARDMADLALPSRSTTTQLFAQWMGGVDPDWGGLLRVDPANPLRVVKGAGGNEESLAGTIINDLPGTLKDVTIVWVKSARLRQRAYAIETVDAQRGITREAEWVAGPQSGQMLNIGNIAKLPSSGLESGASFNMASQMKFDGSTSLLVSLQQEYIDPFASRGPQITADSMNTDPRDQRPFLEMMSIFHQLPPPEYISASRSGSPSRDQDTVTFYRELGRELDLSPWFTRPCVIVLGYLENSAMPIPLRIGDSDEAPSSTGLTMIRWIYPLPLDEEVAFPSIEPDKPAQETE